MNLFENLQLMKESDTSIVSEFKEFLSSKNAQYIANEIGETKDGMQIVIYDGDWKHEHLYIKHLLDEFFTNKGIDISITSEEIGESDQDTFSARYDIVFNAEPKTYTADVKSINEDIDLSEYEYISTGTGYNKGWSLYRKMVDGKGEWVAEHQQTKEVVPINYDQVQGFEPIKLQGVQKLQKDLGDMLLPKRESNKCTNIIPIEYSYDGDEISDYKGYIRVCADTEEEALSAAEKWIKSTHSEINPRHFVVSKDNYTNTNIIDVNGNELKESDNFDINADNAATFEDKLEKELYDAATKLMTSRKWGFPEDEVKDYLTISVNTEDEDVKVSVGAELTYSSLEELGDELNKIITKYDKDSYFDMECPGRMVAYLFGYKKESINKVEETNHNEILDKDYATGEEIYNELEKYLNSLDQIAMDGKDCNWEPSEFNAKNLNADGEIHLECGAYILIYPYINEWAEDYFKVFVVESSDLSIQLKNGIERIFNKFKTDKWKLVYEG